MRFSFLSPRTLCSSFLILLGSSSMGSETFRTALGIGSVLTPVGTYSVKGLVRTSPEIVFYGYQHLKGDFWIRPGARASLSWMQPEMSASVKINEVDFSFGAEVALEWSWIVLPSLSIGAGAIYRRTSLIVQPPVLPPQVDDISGYRLLPYLQSQLGIGFPIEHGLIVFEPFFRHTVVFSDPLINWAAGAVVSVSLN